VIRTPVGSLACRAAAGVSLPSLRSASAKMSIAKSKTEAAVAIKGRVRTWSIVHREDIA
jgi:hypothetical protein